ncbi:recombination regulator RecX [Actimicrobium sp. CCI2.3]|uniref:recombination regulator RecX n=1 Tax=Actimicrobium sp. CCI2.3 TaxID=3048616 RepID=UPI002AB41BA6|nr:recombination regulator RecX [Actimicrobium sp. CCI2.3]MDY7576086.1 recombination regulator RecX [Actimicrobium sp. CCI2.3]MEB0023016.1 recombination regulator RecX [Actimicrobium sp. CCI2.3]
MARPVVSLKARALRFLSMREHSRLELARKLQRHVQEGDDVEALLDWLESAKFLSQARFSESLIHRRAARYGNSRIISELQSHGIQGDALVDLKGRLQVDELTRARDVWLKKFGTPAADASERGKQMRFLQQRGFSHKAIESVMRLRGSDEWFPDDTD